MLISDSYRQLNATLHQSAITYGTSGAIRIGEVTDTADKFDCESILDYGCGKGDLKRALVFRDIREYDPAIEGKDAMPEPADLVYCGDVLEHVEPEHLLVVLDHIASLTRKVFMAVVHTGPAKKHLADGRNAHLIQQPIEWWLPELLKRWAFIKASAGHNGFIFVGRKCQSQNV